MVYGYMIKIYAVLVKGGRYVISADDNPNNLPVVPKNYQIPVAEYLASCVYQNN